MPGRWCSSRWAWSTRRRASTWPSSRAAPQNLKRANQGLFWQFNAREGLGHSGSDPGVTAHAYVDDTMTHGRIFIANGSAEEDERSADSARTIWRSLPRSAAPQQPPP